VSNTIEFDNHAPENPKLVRISDRAFRLWFHACCYCNRNLTDGRVPAALIAGLSHTANRRTPEELVQAGLLKRDGDDYLVHDYLGHNPSRAEVDRERRRSRERTANWRAKQPLDTPDVTRHERRTNGVRDAYVTISDKEKDVKGSRELETATAKTLLVCDTLSAQIRERDPQAKFDPRSERTLREARLLLERDGRTVEQVAEVLAWLRTDTFWSTVILSTAKLREKFTQLVAKMDAPESDSNSTRRESPSEMLRTIQGSAP
jgi:hypothetical protein